MSDNQNDIPLSEPLPDGVELTEVADGERSEVMERALIDAANAGEQENAPEKRWAPTPVWEVPDHMMQGGLIAHHDGSTESAVRIAEWLNTRGVRAFVVPKYSSFPAFIKLNAFVSAPDRSIVTRDDFVFVAENNDVRVYRDDEAQILFRVQNDDTPVGEASRYIYNTPRDQ